MDWLKKILIFNKSFTEQKVAVRAVWEIANNVIQHNQSQQTFKVELDDLPAEFLQFKKNLFSTLFISLFHILKISPRRRKLYASLNHLFRCWVTSADNLLDNEDKVTFALKMPNDSRVMRQVVSIMLADRIMNQLLAEARTEGSISEEHAKIISEKSLQILLPSAAEEGMEELGLPQIPHPDFVISEIHPVKTGILFHIPFLGPEFIEESVDVVQLAELKSAMMDFGLGCQILDDIRDLSRDFQEKRANYFISQLYYNCPDSEYRRLETLQESANLDLYVADQFPEVLALCENLAMEKLNSAIDRLDKHGLSGFKLAKKQIVHFLLKALDLPNFGKLEGKC